MSNATDEKKKEMTEPIVWQFIPTTGMDLELRHYRSIVDGQGWMVVVMRVNDAASGYQPFASYFVPDPNGMWGMPPDHPVRKSRFD